MDKLIKEDIKMEETKVLNVEQEEVKEERVLPESEPKTIIFEVGINGVPKLDIRCDTEISVRDIATALATIDLLNFNRYLKADCKTAVKNHVLFDTLRKEMFINGVAQLTGGDKEILDSLSEML